MVLVKKKNAEFIKYRKFVDLWDIRLEKSKNKPGYSRWEQGLLSLLFSFIVSAFSKSASGFGLLVKKTEIKVITHFDKQYVNEL